MANISKGDQIWKFQNICKSGSFCWYELYNTLKHLGRFFQDRSHTYSHKFAFFQVSVLSECQNKEEEDSVFIKIVLLVNMSIYVCMCMWLLLLVIMCEWKLNNNAKREVRVWKY